MVSRGKHHNGGGRVRRPRLEGAVKGEAGGLRKTNKNKRKHCSERTTEFPERLREKNETHCFDRRPNEVSWPTTGTGRTGTERGETPDFT